MTFFKFRFSLTYLLIVEEIQYLGEGLERRPIQFVLEFWTLEFDFIRSSLNFNIECQ